MFRVTTLKTMWNSLTVCALLRGTRHVKSYSSYHTRTSVTVSGGGRTATVHDPKPYTEHLRQNRLLLNTCMDTNMQFTINSFRQLFPHKIFSLTFPWFLVKSLTFPWQVSNSLTFSGFPDKWSPWMLQFYAELAMIILLKFLNDSLLRVVSTGWRTASIKYYFGAAVIWLCKFLHIWLCQLNWWLY